MKKKPFNYAISNNCRNNYTDINNAFSVRLFVTCYVQRLRELCGAKITVVQVLVIAGENFPPFRSRLTKVWLQNKGVLVSETLRGKNASKFSVLLPEAFRQRQVLRLSCHCLVTVFETISPPKTRSSKICHGQPTTMTE